MDINEETNPVLKELQRPRGINPILNELGGVSSPSKTGFLAGLKETFDTPKTLIPGYTMGKLGIEAAKSFFKAGARYPRALGTGIAALMDKEPLLPALKRGFIPDVPGYTPPGPTYDLSELAQKKVAPWFYKGKLTDTKKHWLDTTMEFGKLFPFTLAGTMGDIYTNPSIFLLFQGIHGLAAQPEINQFLSMDVPMPKGLEKVLKGVIKVVRPFEGLSQKVRDNRVNLVTEELLKRMSPEAKLRVSKEVFKFRHDMASIKTKKVLSDTEFQPLLRAWLLKENISEVPITKLHELGRAMRRASIKSQAGFAQIPGKQDFARLASQMGSRALAKGLLKVVEKAGGEYTGIQRDIPGKEDEVLINEPITKSTFNIPLSQIKPKTVTGNLERVKKNFGLLGMTALPGEVGAEVSDRLVEAGLADSPKVVQQLEDEIANYVWHAWITREPLLPDAPETAKIGSEIANEYQELAPTGVLGLKGTPTSLEIPKDSQRLFSRKEAQEFLQLDDKGNTLPHVAERISVASTQGKIDPLKTIGGESNQTDLEGMRGSTLNEVYGLARDHKVEIVITGGTELGHSTKGKYTHEKGYKVDIRLNPKLNSLIESWEKYSTKHPLTKVIGYTNPDTGSIYWKEKTHWDVEVVMDNLERVRKNFEVPKVLYPSKKEWDTIDEKLGIELWTGKELRDKGSLYHAPTKTIYINPYSSRVEQEKGLQHELAHVEFTKISPKLKKKLQRLIPKKIMEESEYYICDPLEEAFATARTEPELLRGCGFPEEFITLVQKSIPEEKKMAPKPIERVRENIDIERDLLKDFGQVKEPSSMGFILPSGKMTGDTPSQHYSDMAFKVVKKFKIPITPKQKKDFNQDIVLANYTGTIFYWNERDWFGVTIFKGPHKVTESQLATIGRVFRTFPEIGFTIHPPEDTLMENPLKQGKSIDQLRKDLKELDLFPEVTPKAGGIIHPFPAELLEKGVTITGREPALRMNKDVPVKDIHGDKITLPKGEEYTPYTLSNNQILLTDGESLVVNKNKLDNIEGHSTELGYKTEEIGLKEIVKGGKADPKYPEYVLPGGKNYREILFQTPIMKGEPGYKGPHWKEPNVFSQVRLNDRTGPKGEKILFIEEIQSDWATAFRTEEKKYMGLGKALMEASPLGSLKNWKEITLQKVLDIAIKEGYDAISWTTGEQQTDRYDLSKQVDEIMWRKGEEDNYYLTIKKDGKDITAELAGQVLGGHTPQGLERIIGKGPTDKILSSKRNKGVLRGEDLKIGGEWTKVLYDKQIPSIFKKLTKVWEGETERIKPGTPPLRGNDSLILSDQIKSGLSTPQIPRAGGLVPKHLPPDEAEEAVHAMQEAVIGFDPDLEPIEVEAMHELEEPDFEGKYMDEDLPPEIEEKTVTKSIEKETGPLVKADDSLKQIKKLVGDKEKALKAGEKKLAKKIRRRIRGFLKRNYGIDLGRKARADFLAKILKTDDNKGYIRIGINQEGLPPNIKPPEDGRTPNPLEIEEAINKLPQPRLRNWITNQFLTISRDLKKPEIWYAVDDAFYNSYADGKALITQYEDICLKIWGKKKGIPKKLRKEVYQVLTGKQKEYPEDWMPLVYWWDQVSRIRLGEINLAHRKNGLEEIDEVEHYLHRRLNQTAKLYLNMIYKSHGKSSIGDLPPELLKAMKFLPAKKKNIPMLYERTISNPEVVLKWINESLKAEGKEPLETIYQEDADLSIRSVLWSETKYPHFLEALTKVQELKKDLHPDAQTWIDSWVKHQILSRPTQIDKQTNAQIKPLIKVMEMLPGVELGFNPIKAIAHAYGKLLYMGALPFNFGLAGLNMLQDFHNMVLAGPIPFIKAKMAILSDWSDARKIIHQSRVAQRRIPMEHMDVELWHKDPLGYFALWGSMPFRMADMNNVITGFLSHLYRQYKEDPKMKYIVDKHRSPKLKGRRQLWNAIGRAAEKNQILDQVHIADYWTYVGQYPYIKYGQPAISQSGLGSMAQTFKTWPQSYTFGFFPELVQRAIRGKTSLGKKVSSGQRLGLLWYAIEVSLLYMAGKKIGWKRAKRLLPWVAMCGISALSPEIAMMTASVLLATGLLTDNKSSVTQGIKKLKGLLSVHFPAGVAIRGITKSPRTYGGGDDLGGLEGLGELEGL